MRAIQIPIVLVLLATTAGALKAGEISPALESQMAAKADGEQLTVLVVLRDGVDVQALDLGLHAAKVDLATRHRTVVTRLREAASLAQANLVAELDAARSRGEIQDFRPYWIINAVRLTADEATIRAIAARPDVEIVEPGLRVELIAPVERREAAAKDSDGIGITQGLVNINARRVWDELGIRGEGALIGSLDTGVDGNHPALADRWRGLHAPWQECWLDVVAGTSEFPVDLDGHGTHCTGTMTGVAPDDTIGVAPAAEWIATNPIEQTVGGEFDTDIITCFEWFADPDGDPETLDDVPDVVQNSWGVHTGFGYPTCDSRWWDVIDACEAAGPVVIFAAGNEGSWPSSLRSPADRATTPTNCFSVGATEIFPPFEIAGFSSRGPAGESCGPEENRIKPEVSGPGVNVYSASPGGGYVYLSGTSMATPHVCGVVALMRSANPDADVITIKEVLMGSSLDLGETGEDNTYGHGFIDAYAAVTQIMGGFGNIEGIVTDAQTGDPVADAYVKVPGTYGDWTTDETGYYALRLPAGAHTIEVVAYSYEDLAESVTIIVDDTVTADLQLITAPRITVSGTVYLPGANPVDGGTPAAGATIAIENAPEPPVTADAAGNYSVALPIGFEYRLAVTAGPEGHLQQTIPFHADLDLDLFLNAGNVEGFESGDLDHFGWSTGGTAGWEVQSDIVHTGDYAARSGAVGDGQYSQIRKFVDCGDGGEMSFWFKVSSEADDFLQFFIGNTMVGEWSGEVPWTQGTYPVGPGNNNIRVRYQKGASGAAGADAAWVDDFIFPGIVDPAPKLVVSPVVVLVEMDVPDQVSAPGYLFNMGGEDLEWTVAESADWLTLAPVAGTLPPGAYQELTFDFDAAGLPDGTHTALVAVASNDPVNPVMDLQARLELDTEPTAIPEGGPHAFALHGAVPNPFNPATVVRFTLPANRHAVLGLYDVRGRLVRTLVDEVRPAGLHEVRWDGRDAGGRSVASGTYFARLQSEGRTVVKSLTLVR